MSRIDRLTAGITEHSRVIIAVMLVLTVVLGAGAGRVDSSSSLDQFESDSPEAAAQSYISENFSRGENDTQITQVIVRNDDGNVLTKASLLQSLEYQQSIRANETLNETLIEENAIVGVSNLVAITAIQQEAAAELQAEGAQLQQRQQQLEADKAALENRSTDLNRTAELLRGALTELQQNPNASVEAAFEDVQQQAPVELDDSHFQTFQQAAQQLRNAETESEAEQAYKLGTQGVLQSEYEAVQQQGQELADRGEQLQTDFEAFEQKRQSLQASGSPTLAEQREQLESMNESEIDDVLKIVLGEASGSNGQASSPFAGVGLQLMEKDYEPGSTTANARMMIVQQVAQSDSDLQGGSSVAEKTIQTQLEMQDLAEEVSQSSDDDYIVFGFGVISQEIDQSMADSLAIVGPLALLFVLLTLLVAYRDIVDIVLGLVGIVFALVWTFGVMGWFDIAFNQIMIAVPVLLIGLSIDYAIHIFMRHREERLDDGTPSDVRGSMRYALAGVGIALLWVTATTVIGFLSNLTSPLSAIADFGIVSSWGIIAALAIFGAFIPALKVEADELLESYGFDRKKRAFGTGGGRFSEVLKVGSTLAKTAPVVVILVALAISAAGAYGGSQVDTSFAQEDFIADEPADWMYELPGPFAPGEYSAKQNLDYVNDHFQREDSKAEVLIRGGVTDPRTLQALADAQRDIDDGEYETPFAGASGEVATRSPLTVMADVAAQNESFNQTLANADTDGDGVPDRNVKQVYDELFAVAPDEAGGVIYRTDDGGYEAVRLVVPVAGDAATKTVTAEMRGIASDIVAGSPATGEQVIATGSPVVNEVVQNDLLETVIQSLVITLVAVFVFLMLAYRITEGSATLGIVTLLPVALSVAWILGTMYLIGMPFNVLTGMITSLTVGLGVAYSIHVSERFNLELDRRGDQWEAMDRTITGTGGALLGSAATTVGGFGVLSFAIFPALQQFGVITALTIIYAFLASVLVLPSLLVVWHRYVGPTETPEDEPPVPQPADDTAAESDDALVPTAESRTPTGSQPTAPAITEAEADAPAVVENGGSGSDGEPAVTGSEGWQTLADEPDAAATAPGSEPSIRASRKVSDVTPDRGAEFTVRLDVAGATGRILLAESVPGTGGEVSTLRPRPTSHAMVGRRLYVLWELKEPTDVTLSYSASVPSDAKAGETLSFDSSLQTRAGEGTVDGPASMTVTTPFLRDALSGPVTQATLDRASEKARDGTLARDELEYLYECWLGDEVPEPSASQRTDGGADE
ncbi:MMPL family transporter [Haloarchaeobius sp. TZWWS8]|uniref:MMPL family transporter n=1 Tax=Haloarchaeobius sp. TZWWS8 TaxID=3446121 RepID=UPI003EBA3D90